MSGMYDRVFTRVFASRIETVVSGLGIEPGARVLEVGVGTGLSLDSYPSHCQVTGIDVSEDMLELARKKLDAETHAHIKLECMDAMDLPFEDGSFDYVTAFHVVTVVPDPARLVQEMARICKPNGDVVIINHFSSQRRAVRAVVNMVDPLTRRLGWSTRLALDEVIGKPSLRLKNRYKTSPWSLFTVVEARKEVDFLPGS